MKITLIPLLFALTAGCGATQTQAPASPLPSAATPSAANVPSTLPPGPADSELESRGLHRVDGQPNVAQPNWADTLGSLYILARTRDGRVALVGSNAQLHTGEQIELHVNVGRPAYVHLIQISSTDEATLLYPAPGEPEKMLPGVDYRIPTDTNVRFELDEHVGTERLAFVVTEQPLDSGDASVRAFMERLRTTGHWSAATEERAATSPKAAAGGSIAPRSTPETSAAPVHGTGGTRGWVRASSGGRALDVQPDDQGVALALFTFQHLP